MYNNNNSNNNLIVKGGEFWILVLLIKNRIRNVSGVTKLLTSLYIIEIGFIGVHFY